MADLFGANAVALGARRAGLFAKFIGKSSSKVFEGRDRSEGDHWLLRGGPRRAPCPSNLSPFFDFLNQHSYGIAFLAGHSRGSNNYALAELDQRRLARQRRHDGAKTENVERQDDELHSFRTLASPQSAPGHL